MEFQLWTESAEEMKCFATRSEGDVKPEYLDMSIGEIRQVSGKLGDGVFVTRTT